MADVGAARIGALPAGGDLQPEALVVSLMTAPAILRTVISAYHRRW
jgi:hypothetical protein